MTTRPNRDESLRTTQGIGPSADNDDELHSEIRRLEGRLLEHRRAVAEVEALLPSLEAHRRSVIECDVKLDDARQRLSATVAESDLTSSEIDEAVMRLAGVTGQVTISKLKAVLDTTPVHQLERALKRLVDAGRLEATDETARGLGRGRAARVYLLVGGPGDTGRTSRP